MKKTFKDFSTEENLVNFLNKLTHKKDYLKYRTAKIDWLDVPFSPPELIKIPKPEGGLREVLVYETKQNFHLKFLNYYLNKYHSSLINSSVVSYQSGTSVGFVVKQFSKNYNPNLTYIKLDLVKYFNSPPRELVLPLLEKIGLDLTTYISLFNSKVLYKGEIINYNSGLLPGSPISGYLSNIHLNEFDNLLTLKYPYYCRYSDDMIIGINPEDSLDDTLEEIRSNLSDLQLEINDKKTSIFRSGDPVSFLGCKINQGFVSLNINKKKNFRNIVRNQIKTSMKCKHSLEQVMYKIYFKLGFKCYMDPNTQGSLGFIFSCVTNLSDIQEMDYFLLDKLKYFMTGSNKPYIALSKGFNTKFFEQHGFVSFVKAYHEFQSGKFIYSAFCYDTLDRLSSPVVDFERRLVDLDSLLDLAMSGYKIKFYLNLGIVTYQGFIVYDMNFCTEYLPPISEDNLLRMCYSVHKPRNYRFRTPVLGVKNPKYNYSVYDKQSKFERDTTPLYNLYLLFLRYRKTEVIGSNRNLEYLLIKTPLVNISLKRK